MLDNFLPLTLQDKPGMLRAYGESVRLDTRTKSENPRKDQGSYNRQPDSTRLFCVRALELGFGGRVYERARALECVDSQPKVWFSLRRLRLLNLRQYSLFQPCGVRVCVGNRARHG